MWLCGFACLTTTTYACVVVTGGVRGVRVDRDADVAAADVEDGAAAGAFGRQAGRRVEGRRGAEGSARRQEAGMPGPLVVCACV